MTKRIFCWCILFLFVHITGKSQQAPFANNNFTLSPDPVRSSFFDHYISGIALDKTGFLWIGTNKGLLRYDGTTIKKFNLESSGRFSTLNDVLYLVKTKKEGSVFARSKSGNLYKIHNGAPYLFDSSQRTNYYSYLLNGNFPSEEALKVFNKGREELTGNYQFSLRLGNIIALDNDRLLAVDKSEMAVLLYNEHSTVIKRIPLNGQFESYLQLGNRFFILTRQLETYEFMPSTAQLLKVSNDIVRPGPGAVKKNIHFYCDFSSGRSFYLSDNRLYELLPGKKKNVLCGVFMTHVKTMQQAFLQIITDTSTGAHFFSTKVGGFYTGEYTRLKTHRIPLALMKNYKDPSYIIPYAVQKVNDSTVIVPNGTFLTFTGGDSVIQRQAPGRLISNRYSIAMLSNKDIVCAAPEGVLKHFSARSGYTHSRSFTRIPFVETDDSPVGLMMVEGDSLWVCSHKGIYYVRKGEIVPVFKRPKSNNDGVFFEMRYFGRIDTASILMSNQYGLFRLHTRQPFRVDTIQAGTISYVRNVLKIDDMLLLCSYKTGLFLYKDGAYRPVPLYGIQNELKLCHNSFLDEDGMLWITTDKGLYKTTLTSLLNSTEPGAPPPLFFKYGGIHDRTENIEFNGGGLPSFALLRNNTLVYPAINGLVSFNYKELDEKLHFTAHSLLYTVRTSINNPSLPYLNDSLRLPADAVQLYIDASIPYFGNMENVVLEFRYGSDWAQFPYETVYKGISVKTSPGYSELWLRVRNGYGKDDYVMKKLTIYRAYKLTETAWFYPVLSAVLLLIIFVIVRINSKRIGKINRKLEQKIARKTNELKSMVETKNLLLGIISHDMISPIRHIAMLSNLVVKKEKLDTQEMYETLSTIRFTCEKLHMEFTGVVNWIKHTRERIVLEQDYYNLYEMVEDSINIYMSLETVRKVSLINDIEKDRMVFVDPRLFSPIINNIISNAVKNTYQGEIRISGYFSNDEQNKTTLVIRDTGIGFKPAALERIRTILSGDYPSSYANYGSGLGFFMIAELSRLHNTDITIESESGAGTTVTLVF